MQTETTTTTETTTILSETLLDAIRTQARIASAAAELEAARKYIRQVSISCYALRTAGVSVEETDELLRTLRSVEVAIEDAARAADRNARDAQSVVLDIAEGLAK